MGFAQPSPQPAPAEPKAEPGRSQRLALSAVEGTQRKAGMGGNGETARLATSSRLWRPSTQPRGPLSYMGSTPAAAGKLRTQRGRGIADFGLRIADLKADSNEGGGNDCGPARHGG